MTDPYRLRALLDANVLASITLTDVLVQLAVDDLYQARWTREIHQEWISAVREFRPDLDAHRLERRRQLMDARTRDALITGYEEYMNDLALPDNDDHHVLAAAIRGQCDLIITMNLKHFPRELLRPHNILAQHPDAFLANLMQRSTLLFCASIRKVRLRASNPGYSIDAFLEKLLNAGLNQTAADLADYRRLLE